MAPIPRPPLDRFWEKVDKNGPVPVMAPELGPCWLWTAYTMDNGYSGFKVGSATDGSRRTVSAHRWYWQQVHGPVPEGLQLDHICHDPKDPSCPCDDTCWHRRCVNPSHLRAVTLAANVERSSRHHTAGTGRAILR